MGSFVDADAAGFQYVVFSGFAAAAQDGFDAGDEDFRGEWFGDVFVYAEVKAEEFVAFFAFGGEHDDRNFGVLADFAADLPAVHFGHHDVEDDEGDVFLGVEGVYGLFAVTGFDDVVSGFY